MNFIRILVVLGTLSVAACQQSGTVDPKIGLTRSEFIGVMSDLQLAQPEHRAAILKKHRTTEAEIRAFVQALAADPIALSATLDSIQNRVERGRTFPVQPPPQ
ncbi:MAG: hypothetical protein ACT4O1_03890 [Gemmatimonadota bacterium]